MRLAPSRIAAFLQRPDPEIRAVLLYGPDEGLVRERAAAIARSVCADLKDPFRVADLTAAVLAADPARLADEAAQLSLTGGRRVVRVRGAGDGLAKLFAEFLGGTPGEAFVAVEAGELCVGEIFVTGGEPFLLGDIGEILAACAAAAPTTVLTNGLLFAGRRLEALRALPRDRLSLQISVDSPTPERHDRHRGKGTWARAWRGIERARMEGFRVRLAATVSTDAEAEEFRRFLDRRQIAEQDRVIRHIALRGFAEQGVALARADLVPEITVTADGVYWHPVGAEDGDLFVTADIFPLAEAFAAVRRAFAQEHIHQRRLATIFNCA